MSKPKANTYQTVFVEQRGIVFQYLPVKGGFAYGFCYRDSAGRRHRHVLPDMPRKKQAERALEIIQSHERTARPKALRADLPQVAPRFVRPVR